MLRSDEMTSISIYLGSKNIRETIEILGEQNLIQIKYTEQNNISLKNIEKIEQRLQHLKNEIEDINNIYSNNNEIINFKESEKLINQNYKNLIEIKHSQKEHIYLRQIAEENYKIIEEALLFIESVDSKKNKNITYNFITAITERDKKFLIKKILKTVLKKNCYIKIIDTDLKYNEKQKSIFIIYVYGKHPTEKVVEVVETMGGRVYDSKSILNNFNNSEKILPNESTNNINNSLKNINNNDLLQTDSSSQNITDSTDSLQYINNTNLLKEKILIKLKEENKIVKNLDKKLSEVIENTEKNYKNWKIAVNKERKIYETFNLLKCENSDNNENNNTNNNINNENNNTNNNINNTNNNINNKNNIINNIEDNIDNIGIKNNLEKGYVGEAWIKTKNIPKLEKLISNKNNKFYFEKTKIKENEIIPTGFSNNKFTESFQNLTNVFGVPKYQEINPGVFMVFTFPMMFGVMFGDVFHGLILLSMAIYMIKKFDKLNHNCGVLQIILEGRFVILTCGFAAIWFGILYSDFASRPITLFNSQYQAGRTYPLGLDPVWHHAANKMAFTNGLKMKLSLILGFCHMLLGSLISIANSIFFKDTITLFCVVIPQTIAFTLFLGYLVFLCVYKWLVTIDRPSIITTLIGMYTDPFNIRDQMFQGQMYVQLFIVSVILVCVPWMFFSKPFYMISKKKVKSDQMLDLWINSGIHTIEFGLGLISNTSSYLRLWAVSLAHVQLTSVLHQFTIGNDSWIMAIALSPVYITATLLLLIGLEGLSSCLHALRLNWIEFFSKFYSGGGEEFKPLTFEVPHEEIYE